MALIPPTAHAVVDYTAGIALFALPIVLGLPSSTSTLTLHVVGIATILVSLMTAYRLSIRKLIPYKIHLVMDAALGVVMLVAGSLTLGDGLPAQLMLAAGLVYLVVPVLSWPAGVEQRPRP